MLSLFGAAAFLWVASHYIDLWPRSLTLPRPWALGVAVALQVPYSLVRAMRLRYVLDPRVAAASGDPRRRFSKALIYGSGLVSFLVLLLPFKMGEAWRPLALAAGRQPGVRLTEAVGAVAVERLLDAMIIVGLLFGGLARSDYAAVESLSAVQAAQGAGTLMAGIAAVSVLVLVWAARAPERLGRAIDRLLGARMAKIFVRSATTFAGLLDPRQGLPFALWSLAYWAITVGQLWWVARACGLDSLGLAEAAATIAIIGLAIQAPGGPANSGTFQMGMATALALFVGPQASEAGSSFAALMYALSTFGVTAMALPGVVIQAVSRRANRHDPSAPSQGPPASS